MVTKDRSLSLEEAQTVFYDEMTLMLLLSNSQTKYNVRKDERRFYYTFLYSLGEHFTYFRKIREK